MSYRTSSRPIPTRRHNPCQICSDTSGKCRELDELLLCMASTDAHSTPSGFKFLGLTKNGLWGKFLVDNGLEISQEERTRRHQERQAAKKTEQQARNSAALSPSERDKATRQMHKRSGLSTKHRQNLLNRGLSDAQIAEGYFFSVAPGDVLPFGIPANYPGAKNGKLSVAGTGFVCPAWSVDGKIIGWQLRLDDATENKYRWAKGNVSSHLANGELPLTVVRPAEVKHQWVADIEGILKPYIASHKLGAVCIGAAGGNITASPEQFKQAIASLGVNEIRDFPDAGDVCNDQVMHRRVAKYEFYRSLGLSVKIAWWNQITKKERDIDELSTLDGIRYISVDDFLVIARHHGFKFAAQQAVQGCDEPDAKAYDQYLKQEAEREQWENEQEAYLADKKRQEKVQWLARYPERVEWNQNRLKSLAPFNPIIQNTQFIELLVKDFLPKNEPQQIPIYNQNLELRTQNLDNSLTNLPEGLYGLVGSMGCGKSHLMKEKIIKKFKEGNLISFRNSLLTQVCYDEGVKDIIHFLWDLEKNDLNPKDKQQKWKKAKETWMAACIESIAKCRAKDVLVLEEVEKIKKSLLESSTCRRERRGRLREFVYFLQRAKYIFCLDADLSGSTLNWLGALVPEKEIKVIHNIKQRFQWQCYFFTGAKEILTDGTIRELPNKRADFEIKLLSKFARGEKLLISSDSQRWGESIERALLMVNPEAKGLRVDSITKVDDRTKDQVEAFLKNPNKWIQKNKPDYIIYTPTCEASVDITIEDYFDAVFGCFVHLNHLSCKQMLGRLRTNAPRFIFAKTHAINDDGGSKSPLPQVVMKHMFEHNFETIREILLAEYPEIQDDFQLLQKMNEVIDFKSKQYKDPHVQALVESIAMDNYSRANLRQNLALELQRCGHIVNWVDAGDAEVKSPSSPFRKEIMKEWAEAIANAADIDISQAWEIQQSMTANLEERQKATKAIIKDRLPEFFLTANFIHDCYLDDRHWISRQELRYLLDHPEIAKKLDCDRWASALKFDTAWWDVRTNSLVIKALRTLGIPEIAKSGKNWDKETDWVLEFKQRVIANSKLVLLALGITATEESDACYLLRRCLERAGYAIKRRQHRIGNGKRVRYYQVDTAVLMEDHSIYAEAYKAIGKRFAQKLNKDLVAQSDLVDISISPVRDTPPTMENAHLAETPDDIQELLHPVEIPIPHMLPVFEEQQANSPFKLGDAVRWLGDAYDGAWGCDGIVIDHFFGDIKVRWTRKDGTAFDRRQSVDEIAAIDNLMSA